ncbi:MAG: 4Fe-4S dicluster domain-containing protein [Planctomycetota bacterium]|nr:4Fe-4S dicluster domain-containing protein [Planctomycetota bacterium]
MTTETTPPVETTTLDPGFKHEVSNQPGGENLKVCFACGVCTAGCPVSEIDPSYNPRRIIRMILLGMRERVLSSDAIWLCAMCYTCYAHCPQNVKFTNIMSVLRNMAEREGFVKPEFVKLIGNVDDLSQRVRRRMVLSVLKNKESMKEVDVKKLLADAAKEEG